MKKGKINIDYTEYETNIPESIGRTRGKRHFNRNKKLLNAFIPGNIKAVFVKEGDKVVTGQALLILEAMKMENEILSPMSGTIKSVKVSKGDRVTKDQLLIELE